PARPATPCRARSTDDRWPGRLPGTKRIDGRSASTRRRGREKSPTRGRSRVDVAARAGGHAVAFPNRPERLRPMALPVDGQERGGVAAVSIGLGERVAERAPAPLSDDV